MKLTELQTSKSYHKIRTVSRTVQGPLLAGGAKATKADTPKDFVKDVHCYLELYFQSKHSNLIAGHCRTLGIAVRTDRGTMCEDGDNATLALSAGGFYGLRADTAADVAAAHLMSVWRSRGKDAHDYLADSQVNTGSQGTVQHDGHSYDLSYFYTRDALHVHFHCYPGR